MTESPCKTCTRVILPYNCDKKECPDWRQWFLDKWAEYNKFYEKYGKESGNDEKQ